MTIKEGVCTNPIFFVIFTFSFTFFFIGGLDSSLVSGITTIRPGEGISFADSLVSQGGNFTLGFFTVKQTKYSYLGIWYIKDSQLWRVWVANPNKPLNDSGVLTIESSTRILKITSRGRTVLNISDQVAANNVTATLQDSGNFVLTDHENGDRILWESFDHPTDTLLPGMKLGFSIATGQKKNWSLTSWLSDYFPTSGAFTMNWEPSKESGQLVIYRRGERYWTSGLLRNQTQTFESIPTLSGPPIRYRYILNYISNNDEKYFTFSGLNGSLLMWMLTPNGMIHHGANSLAIGPVDFCYGYHQSDNGCVVTKLPECRSSDDKFVQKRATFLPSNAHGNYDDNSSLSLSDCMEGCWSNCNCVGFNVNSNGTGCITWTGKLEYQEGYAKVQGEVKLLRSVSNSELGRSQIRRLNPRRTLHGEIRVLLGLCHMKLIKAHKQHLGGGDKATSYGGAWTWSTGLYEENYFLPVHISNNDEKYFTFSGLNGSLLMWMLTPNGMIHHGANSLAIGPVDFCYGYHQSDNGCVVTKLPECRSSDDKFVQKRATFLPSNAHGNYDDNSSLSLSDCMEGCWSNCNCVGFNVNSNGTGCITWTGKLEYQEGYANTVPIYVLVRGNSSKGERWIWIVIAVAISLLVLIFGTFCYLRMGKLRLEVEEKRREKEFLQELISSDNFNNANDGEADGTEGHALKILSFASVVEATNNFSIENKLGQGGFGPVYKGKLQEGQVIAVKRLSTTSCQGLVEFKNELILISKLQHTNLVRVLGCCIHGEEKMLIYEFLRNNSLDTYIFGTDPAKRGLLDWTKRLNIIEGVAQGLLYLHKYSRMRVIHRDLKASNVLLDENMNAKISDFGMARIFKINETEANTKRPAGTYGYMSPEYAMLGTFSVKSDVFSFGVLILEIVSGRRNTSFYDFDNRSLNLTGYAWELWKEGTALELKDPAKVLKSSCGRRNGGGDAVAVAGCKGRSVTVACAMDRPMMLDMGGGIWYTNDSTSSKVWVGNRNTPIANNSGVLTIDNAGNLIITHIGGGPIELYGAQTNTNISATLLDSGNFIMTEVNNNGSNKRVLWESFDYPADTLLPGMKLGVNHQTGQNWSLTSWLGRLIPALGTVTLEWDPSERRLIVKQGGGWVWELWNKDTVLDLMDPMLSNSCINQQLVRCIHVGLLCVEYRAVDRPTMSDVISMLNNDKTVLSVPKKPTFVFGRDVVEKELHKCKSEKHWRLSSTTMDGR
ncbi:unnamed protein product [Camellia sinensis]